jgi:hypothetical protein
MNVYQYIAQNNPDAANEVCKKYGYYQIANLDELAHCLQMIVADEQEQGLTDVLELHPDKDTILELFEKKKIEPVATTTTAPAVAVAPVAPCGCSNNGGMMNADGTTTNTGIALQTNTYILLAAVIVSVAIISMRNK